ncbi:MAG TPA: AMP-binding protein, partial [Nocardioides sp.]
MTLALSHVTDRLHRPQLRSDLLVRALRQGGDGPALEIAGEVLSASQVAAVISQYEQAFRELGIDSSSRVAMLVNNRVEVLYATGAQLLVGCVSTNLHPLGSAQDHAYALVDAGIDTLIFGPESFGPRAAELHDLVPTLDRIIALGPSDVGVDVSALAQRQGAQPLVTPDLDPDDVNFIGYTGGTTGRPKGVVHTNRTGSAMLQMMMTGWEWPEAPRHLICTPLSHAGGMFLILVLFNGG